MAFQLRYRDVTVGLVEKVTFTDGLSQVLVAVRLDKKVAPYVDEEVAWAIKHHQSLRFLPAPELGYEYPALYTRAFGENYDPPEYIKKEWDYCRNHKWYMSAMQVVLNDLYAFDPNVTVELEEFEDVVAKHFRQPDDGLGFDGSPVAHMWRTMIWPNNFL